MQNLFKELMSMENKSVSKRENNIFTNLVFVVLLALLCCALWGSATPFIKLGYQEILKTPKPDVPSTILFAGTRFSLAGLLTVLIYSVARKKIIYPAKKNLGRIGIIALLQTVIQYFFFYIGLANTSGDKGTIISGTSCFFALLISSLIFKQEKLTTRKIIACIIGFAGIVAVNLNGFTLTFNIGDGCVLMSGISLAFSSVLIKLYSKHEDPVVISGYQFMAGGVVMIITGLIAGGKMDFDSWKGVLILVYLALLSAVAYALWGMLLKFNPVSRVTVFNFTTPIFGVILVKLLMPEQSSVNIINLIIALALVSLGVFLLNYNKHK